MTRAQSVAGVAFLILMTGKVGAQPPSSNRRLLPKPRITHVVVRDVNGTPLEDIKVTIPASAGGDVATDAAGTAAVLVADGSYRLRFEREGFITLERDVTIKNGLPAQIDVVMSRALTPPAPEVAAPPARPEPREPPSHPEAAAGPPVNLSLPGFLDKNLVGREPLKESILSCMPDATIRLLQLRDPVAAHSHADADEILYVVAGDGAVRIEDESTAIAPGSLSVIPRGTSHAIERRGKNPLIVLSTIAGHPCSAVSSPPGR